MPQLQYIETLPTFEQYLSYVNVQTPREVASST